MSEWDYLPTPYESLIESETKNFLLMFLSSCCLIEGKVITMSDVFCLTHDDTNYDKLVSFAGAGATTPLTGFGYCLAKGVKQAVDKDGPIGIITGGIKGASGGITAAILLGVISSLIFKSKPK
jgi:hypothetical protein